MYSMCLQVVAKYSTVFASPSTTLPPATPLPATALNEVLCASVLMHRGLVLFSSNKESLAAEKFEETLNSIEHLLPPAALTTTKTSRSRSYSRNAAEGFNSMTPEQTKEIRKKAEDKAKQDESEVPATGATASRSSGESKDCAAATSLALAFQSDAAAMVRNVAITTVNNFSVCLFHVGDVFESIVVLEKYIRLNPLLFLHASIVHNLHTCYDVAFKPTKTSSKKAVLSRLVELYHSE